MDAVAWRMVANSVPAVASSSSGARAVAVASQQQQRSSSAAAATVVSSNVSIVKRQFLAGSCSSSSSYRYNAVAAAVRERMTSTGSTDETARRATVVMKTEGAAVGYASALAELAQGKDALETVNKDVERLADLLNNEELYDFLISPVVEDEKKKSILKTLAEDAGFTIDTLSFLYLLVDKKRMLLIKDITKEFETIFNESTDTQLATVTSAVKIEQSQLSLIAKKIQSMSQAKNGFQCMEIVIAASRKATEGSEVTISKSSSSRRMEVCKHMWRKVPSRVVKLLKGPWCGVSTALHVYCCTQGGCVPLRVDSRSAIYRIKCLCAPCCVVGIWLWCCYARSFTSLCFTVEWQHLVSLASFTQ